MSIKADILGYLDTRVGQIVHVNDIAEACKLEIRQVQSNITNIRQTNSGPIDMPLSLQVVTAGHQYLWRPVPKTHDATSPKTPSKRCFEEVGPTKDGSLLIQCEDGSIWKAVEL